MRSLLVLIALTACQQANDVKETDLTDSDTDLTDTAVEDAIATAALLDLDENDASGVSIAIYHEGEVVYAQAFGSARPDEQLAPDTQTLFQIGSTTKMFTAVAMLQQVEASRVSLDDTLAEAYPNSEFALDETFNDQVLLEHLLTHQGAFYDYFDWSADAEDESLQSWHESVFFPNLWLMAEPGNFWNYSNPNFNLAGIVTELHDPEGRSYPDYMQEEVFGPLGMDRTYQRKADAVADGNYATGVGVWIGENGGTREGDVTIDRVPDSAAGRPAGAGTWTTPTQMMEMARFLMNGDEDVLSAALQEAMVEEQVSLGYGFGGGYGYGVMVDEAVSLGEDRYYETPFWDHGGNTLSYTSLFWMLPEHDLAISVLSSGYGTDFSRTGVAAIDAFVDLGEPVEEPELPMDLDKLDQHVGTYDDAYNVGELIITRDGDTLLAEMPFLEELGYVVGEELQTISDQVFYLDLNGAWYDLTFLTGDDEGQSTWARNRAFVCTRVEESDTAEETARFGPEDPERAERVRQLLRDARLPRFPMHLPPPPSR